MTAWLRRHRQPLVEWLPLAVVLAWTALTLSLWAALYRSAADTETGAMLLVVGSGALLLALGYAGGRRLVARRGPVADVADDVLTDRALQILVVLGGLYYLGRGLGNVPPIISAGVDTRDPLCTLADAYVARQESFGGDNGGGGLQSLLNVGGVFQYVTIPLLVLLWQRLRRPARAVGVAGLLFYAVTWLMVGSVKGLADTAVLLVVSVAVLVLQRRRPGESRVARRRALIAVAAVLVGVGVVAVTLLGVRVTSVGRCYEFTTPTPRPAPTATTAPGPTGAPSGSAGTAAGGARGADAAGRLRSTRSSSSSSSPSSSTGSPTASPTPSAAATTPPPAPDHLRVVNPPSGGLGALVYYVAHGYSGLDASLSQPFAWSRGTGSSAGLARLLFFVHVDADHAAYPVRAESATGWPAYGRWETVYPWLASDVTFVGAVLLVGGLGLLLGCSWVAALRRRPGVLATSWAGFAMLAAIYVPLNNQPISATSAVVGLLTLAVVSAVVRSRPAQVRGWLGRLERPAPVDEAG